MKTHMCSWDENKVTALLCPKCLSIEMIYFSVFIVKM